MSLEGILQENCKLGDGQRCQRRWTDAQGGLAPFYTALLIPRGCVQEGCWAPAEREEGLAPPALPTLLGDLGSVVICWGLKPGVCAWCSLAVGEPFPRCGRRTCLTFN